MCISTKSPEIPAPPPEPEKPKDIPEQAKRARKDQTKTARAAAGRSSTILTSPLGLLEQAQTAGKTALGA